MMLELQLLWSALLAYVLAGSTAIVGVTFDRRPERAILTLLVGGLGLHSASIALRWLRLDHGPFVNMFEILSSNIWSLLLVFGIVYWRLRALRPIAAVVLPIMFVMMGWLLTVNPGEGHLPATYHTIWLFVHIGFGKVFFGAVLVATGMAGVILLRQAGRARFAGLPEDAGLEDLAFRFMALGLIFETLMLIAGAIWAQDAWGRYWAWDPLETWAFITWLALAFALHLRVTMKVSARGGAMLIVAVFVLAFLTFFGVPFVSKAPHQGAV